MNVPEIRYAKTSDGVHIALFVGLWVPSILALGAFMAPRREREPATSRGETSR